jgi:L-alanine-DL-glutamate epimerase-like enolase superfamily enzyme
MMSFYLKSICISLLLLSVPGWSTADTVAQQNKSSRSTYPVYAIYMPGLSQISTSSGHPLAVDCARIALSGSAAGRGDAKNDRDLEVAAALDAGITGFIFAPGVMSNDKRRNDALDEYAKWLDVAGRHPPFQIPFMMDCNGNFDPANAAAMAEMFL